MTKKKAHNKKRNVGIIYEQLIKSMAKSLVEGNNEKYRTVSSIMKRHFRPGTELYREFRLFNALAKMCVDKDAIALRILAEAKAAAIDFNAHKLRTEKSTLIKEINHKLNDPEFYQQRIENYRSYATIQTLLNDWRTGSKVNFERVAKYETQICEHLTRDNVVPTDLENHHHEDVNRLTVKIMTEKFNKKYEKLISDEQSDLIREYVFCFDGEDALQQKLEKLKEDTLHELLMFVSKSNNKILQEKIERVKQSIVQINISEINDATISKFLLVSQLRDELLEKGNA